MTCAELSDRFELYTLGVLEGEEKQEVDAHLSRNCPECRRNLKDALCVNALLLSLTPLERRPRRRLKKRVLASIGVERSRWTWAAVLAATCILAVALWLSVQERYRTAELAEARMSLHQVSAERDRMLQALSFLNDPETRPAAFSRGQAVAARGNVFVNPRTGVLLIASNLPRLDSGKAYEMWLIPKSGNPRPAGLFQSDGAGAAFHILSGPVDPADFAAVAVTVEPETGSSAPTTTPILVANL